MALVIKSNGEVSTLLPADGKEFTLEEQQKAVGGYIEIVGLGVVNGKRMFMVVNEDGKLINLPPNMKATALAQRDLIVGDVLIADEIEAGYEG